MMMNRVNGDERGVDTGDEDQSSEDDELEDRDKEWESYWDIRISESNLSETSEIYLYGVDSIIYERVKTVRKEVARGTCKKYKSN